MLSPSQDTAYQYLLTLSKEHTVTGLICPGGCGLTTLLDKLSTELNAHTLRLADFFEQIESLHPLKLEEGIARTLLYALKNHDTVVIDDFSLVDGMLRNCYGAARPNILNPAFDAVWRYIEQEEKKVIFGLANHRLSTPFNKVSMLAQQPAYTAEDFAFLFRRIFQRDLEQIDFDKVFRFAPRLSALQMKRACRYLQEKDIADTEAFLKFLETRALVSNVNTGDVEEVSFASLYGVEEVIRQLEINIVTPLEQDELTKALGLKPKRGVLLYGPPGTGKTTIGRALAHRLRSKFFLIDGTVISGTQDFYQIIQRTFQHAKENAPSVLFIDDCDLLFEDKREYGLYRYLLTMLDGLESKSNAEITIMLTAMNIGSLPPALIRSGRIELWLEMQLPDAGARTAILRDRLGDFPFQMNDEELAVIAEKTTDFTGADLRRLVTDAKNLCGYDLAQQKPQRSLFDYFETAIKQLLAQREQLEKAPAFTAAHEPNKGRRQ